MEVRRSGGRWRETMNGTRARELPTGTVRMTEPAPVESLPANGRRRSGWQGTAAREEIGQPRGMAKGGLSFGGLLDSGNRTGQRLQGHLIDVPEGGAFDDRKPVFGRYRTTATHRLSGPIPHIQVLSEVGQTWPEINDVHMPGRFDHAPRVRLIPFLSSVHGYDLYPFSGYNS